MNIAEIIMLVTFVIVAIQIVINTIKDLQQRLNEIEKDKSNDEE